MKVLVFAPHRDDEVLGVGGTIAKHVSMGDEVFVCEVTDVKENNLLLAEIKEEEQSAHKLLGIKETLALELPVVEMKNYSVYEKNRLFCEVISKVDPEVVYIPHEGDMHTDHYETAQAAMVAVRPNGQNHVREVYAYETLSETEWNTPSVKNAFIPNVWNDISSFFDRKVAAMKCYQSQLQDFPHPRSIKAIESLAALRGSTIGCQHAEAFMLIRKIVR
ncbi:MAG: PIG-L family deacetylase [Lachnospiraceae bacterium]|nr:PIG-L family deacetylase [Lachnospiraceae bacterium]